MKACYIYFFSHTGTAVLCQHRHEEGALLFTCPESWAPKNQTEFEKAAKYYGVYGANKMKFETDEVPF